MTRYFYDTEFLEDGHTIELISIGIVSEVDDFSLYLVNRDAPWARIGRHEWLMENVVPSLPTRVDGAGELAVELNAPYVYTKSEIANMVRDFLLFGEGKPELWAYYAAYDHVALCQLWGRMIDLPDGVPMFTNDIKQEAERLGNPKLPEQAEGEHNALADARHNKVMFDALTEFERNALAQLRRIRS